MIQARVVSYCNTQGLLEHLSDHECEDMVSQSAIGRSGILCVSQQSLHISVGTPKIDKTNQNPSSLVEDESTSN